MKKYLLPLSLLVLGALPGAAEVLTPAQALARVKADGPMRVAARVRGAAPRAAHTVEADGKPAVYLFTPASGGLLALSADSEAEAVVGYSDSFAPGDSLPPALRYMLDFYAAEIADLRAGEITVTAAEAQPLADVPAIAPICTTRWDQSAPYNDLCPEIGGQKAPTGCVATAMAQVLKAYAYPARCSGGTYSYIWQAGQKSLSLNFDNVELKWGGMADSYSDTQSAPEVAALMQAVGYAAQMEYSPNASASNGYHMAEALVRNFDFDCTLNFEHRSWHTFAEWQTIIYQELAKGKPVFYEGATADLSAAHAFVVDGYSSGGFFHLNWGWGGLSDGYFRLSALDPDSQGIGGSSAGYNALQGAIIGLKPGAITPRADAPLHYSTDSSFAAIGSSAKLGSDVTFEGGLFNNGPLLTPKMAPAIRILDSNGQSRYVCSQVDYTNVPVLNGVNTWVINIPRNLADGVYTIFPAVRNSTTKTYYDAMTDIGGDGYIIAEVEGGSIYFENRKPGQLTVSNLTTPAEVYPATPFYISATVSNLSTDVYSGSVMVDVFPEGGHFNSLLGKIGAFTIELEPGESSEIRMPVSFPTGVSLGKYDIALYDKFNRRVATPKTVTLAERPPLGTPTCTSIVCTQTAQNRLTFALDVTCAGGLFADAVYAVITRKGSNVIVDYFASQPIVLANGQSTRATVIGDFADGTPGAIYTAYAYYNNGKNILPMDPLSTVDFTLTAPVDAAISEVGAAADAPVEFFDLSGRRVASPAHGIFIRRQGSSVTKIALP